MTPEQIKEQRDWLDTLTGYTPGPWLAGGDPMDRAVWSSPSDRVCFMAHSLGQDDERHFATAHLIAAAPDLRDRYTAALDEIERLRDALEPFAQVAKHHAADAPEWGPFDSVSAQISILSLRAARAALKGTDQ